MTQDLQAVPLPVSDVFADLVLDVFAHNSPVSLFHDFRNPSIIFPLESESRSRLIKIKQYRT